LLAQVGLAQVVLAQQFKQKQLRLVLLHLVLLGLALGGVARNALDGLQGWKPLQKLVLTCKTILGALTSLVEDLSWT
jgi:hypothetical protein